METWFCLAEGVSNSFHSSSESLGLRSIGLGSIAPFPTNTAALTKIGTSSTKGICSKHSGSSRSNQTAVAAARSNLVDWVEGAAHQSMGGLETAWMEHLGREVFANATLTPHKHAREPRVATRCKAQKPTPTP